MPRVGQPIGPPARVGPPWGLSSRSYAPSGPRFRTGCIAARLGAESPSMSCGDKDRSYEDSLLRGPGRPPEHRRGAF